MRNPLNRARTLRAIALLFLALVLFGTVAALVRSLYAVDAAPHASRPAFAVPAPPDHGTGRAGEQR